MKRIIETKDVEVYKKLLRILGEYNLKAPATGVDRLFDTAVEQGKKILPKDKNALVILDYILSNSVPTAVQKLLNSRFSDLPKIEFRPVIKVGKKHETAWWSRNTSISDKVKDLIDWEGGGKAGRWTNIDGETATLLDLHKEEKK